jgi:tritrans,polycis-undecaprenyl-diphosphate synthase [geranylgeranyl-diphosphate specific]
MRIFAPESIPKHIAIILDGNRRLAKRLMMKPWKGHEWGAEKVRKLIDWADELGIMELTLYTFSIQNFNRPKDEFDYLMRLFQKEGEDLLNDPKLMERQIRINFIGRIHLFPKTVSEVMQQLMEKTKENGRMIVNFAMAYGGREEVIDATKKIAEELVKGTLSVDDINEEVFSRQLYNRSEPDLIIRTGGEKRTSNFLIWQSNYSEWFFLEKFWPEFEKEDLISVLTDYQMRERRFGR